MNENQHEPGGDPSGDDAPSQPQTTPDATPTERIEAPEPQGAAQAGGQDGGTPPPPPPAGGAPYGAQPQPGPGAGPSSGDRLLQDIRALRRSRDDRVLAGVCGGVARQLGIDPLLVRVVTAVLMFFGAGVVLYALGWLLLPVDDGTPSVGEQAVSHRGAHASSRTVLLAVGLTIVVCLGMGTVFHEWDGPFLLALAVFGLLAWLLVRDRRDGAGAVPPYAPSSSSAPAYSAPGHASPSYSAAAYPTPAYPAPSYPSGASAYATGAESAPVTLTKEPQPGGTYPTGPAATNPLPTYQPPRYQPPAGPPPGSYGGTQPPVPPPPPAPRRPHSALFSVTMSLVLVGLGTLKLVDLSGVHVAAGAYPALALGIIGLGLLTGAWFGRSRGLIAMGIIATLLTGAVSAGDAWGRDDDHHVDVRLTPSTFAELPTTQHYGAGKVRYDLRLLDFRGTNRSLDLSIGAGEIVVVVPSDVDVTTTASMGVGQVDLFGQGRGGFPSDVMTTDLGPDGVGGGTLDLTLDAGVGHLEVRRG
jgi:phage shock protein PspC (stress-responsive transcriptional regulator)